MACTVWWIIGCWLACGIAAAVALTLKDAQNDIPITVGDLVRFIGSIFFLAQIILVVEAVEHLFERLDKITIWGRK